MSKPPEVIRRAYNGGQADAQNDLTPWLVDIRETKYASLIVWAQSKHEAEKYANRMIDNRYNELVFEETMCEMDYAQVADEDSIAKYPNYRVEV